MTMVGSNIPIYDLLYSNGRLPVPLGAKCTFTIVCVKISIFHLDGYAVNVWFNESFILFLRSVDTFRLISHRFRLQPAVPVTYIFTDLVSENY